MAKKKKKGSKPSVQKPAGSHLSQESSPVESEGFLELKLNRSIRKGGTSFSRTTETPILYIDQSDAVRLGLQRNSQAFIFFPRGNERILDGTLMCKVDVVHAAQSPDRTSKKGNTVKRGTCNVSPSHLIDAILDDGTAKRTPNTEQESPCLSSDSAQQQTPSKTGFSFAVGGGGDKIVGNFSPSPISTQSSYSTPRGTVMEPKSAAPVWIIAAESPLGKDAAIVLCRDAREVNLQIINSSMDSTKLESCQQVLKQVFLAQCTDKHLHKNEVVTISFQGRPLNFQLNVNESESEAEKRRQILLEFEMEALEIQDEFPDGPPDFESRFWSLLRRGLEDSGKPNLVALYRISRKTDIIFTREDSDHAISSDDNSQEEIGKTSQRAVAGLTSTLQRLKSLLLTPLLKPELFSRASLTAPRGVLLFGNAGVGKSCLARQLALDLQREHPASIRVESVNCASLQSYSAQVGEAEARLCSIFERASQSSSNENMEKTPGTLLIFDDIQLICPKRGGYNMGSDRLAATLLGLLDGIGSTKAKHQESLGGAISNSIVILAITSDPSALDPALRRPGRLDFEIEVPIPDDAETRADIINFHLEDLGKNYGTPRFSRSELLKLGELARGFNGADCMLAVKEAFRTALGRQESELGGDIHKRLPSLTDMKAAIRATKPSAIKSVTVEIPKVLWSSIGGMDSVKAELREAIELPMTHGHLFKQLQIPPPRGILLYGPPGCSKTLMARALATEGQMNFLAVKGPELLSKWLGESERALAALFRRARMASPSIIFFDEIDAIAAERGNAGIGSGGGRLLSQLLTELDGINQTGGVMIGSDTKRSPRVVVVAATNRPDLIDSALMRPGRIDRKIYVGVPDQKSRARIFEIGLQNRMCSDCVDITKLSQDDVSGGYSGAELIAVCKDGALLALEEDESNPCSDSSPKIKMRHLLQAIQGMPRQITPEMVQFYDSFRRSQ